MATTPGTPTLPMGSGGIDLTPLATNGRMIAQQLGILATAVAGLQLTGTVPVSQGGTGQTSLTQNGVLYGNGTLAVGVTAQGAANSILVANAGAPSFSAAPTIGTSVTTPLVIGGTAASSSLTIQSTSGIGTSDSILFKVGNNGAVTAATIASASSFLTLGAGTTAVSPLKLTSGTNLTSATAGSQEYDGVQDYFTIDTSSGRGARPVEQYFHLTSAGSTISSIANYFGTTSNISLVASAYYIIDIVCYFLKTTAGTVTWTFTNSAAPTSQNIDTEFSPIAGIVTGTPTATQLQGNIYNDATAAKTIVSGTLADAVNHYAHFRIHLQNGTGTSLKIQATASAGTITPGINSYWTCRRMSPSNIGTFAA